MEYWRNYYELNNLEELLRIEWEFNFIIMNVVEWIFVEWKLFKRYFWKQQIICESWNKNIEKWICFNFSEYE